MKRKATKARKLTKHYGRLGGPHRARDKYTRKRKHKKQER